MHLNYQTIGKRIRLLRKQADSLIQQMAVRRLQHVIARSERHRPFHQRIPAEVRQHQHLRMHAAHIVNRLQYAQTVHILQRQPRHYYVGTYMGQ